MNTYRLLDEIPSKINNAHLALGVFDGVHKGHERVIQSVMRAAQEAGGKAGVYTFPNHPMDVIDPTNCPPLLTTAIQKEDILAALGVEFLILESFTDSLRNLKAEDFLGRILRKIEIRSVAVGDDFRFGHGRRGDIDFLEAAGKKSGFRVLVVPEERYAGLPISSTIVRETVSHGDVHRVEPVLGRPYEVSGLVVEGDGVGRKLGYPTANVLSENEIWPKRGVYVARARVSGKLFPAVANIGRAPTRRNLPESRLEVHLLEGGQNLYGQRVGVQFLSRLREEMKFEGLEALTKAIGQDVENAKKYFKEKGGKKEKSGS